MFPPPAPIPQSTYQQKYPHFTSLQLIEHPFLHLVHLNFTNFLFEFHFVLLYYKSPLYTLCFYWTQRQNKWEISASPAKPYLHKLSEISSNYNNRTHSNPLPPIPRFYCCKPPSPTHLSSSITTTNTRLFSSLLLCPIVPPLKRRS